MDCERTVRLAVRYDPALIAGIAREIRGRCIGRRVEGLRLNRERREAWLLLAEDQGAAAAIGLLLHPTGGFIVEGGGLPAGPEATDRRIDFRRLFLIGVHAPADERLLVFDLAGGLRDARPDLPPVFRLFVELHTNQWNAVLARGADHRIEAVLWPRAAGGRSLHAGAAYVRPEGARTWAEAPPDSAEWAGALEPIPPQERRDFLLRSISWTSSLNVDWILADAATDPGSHAITGAYDRYMAIRTGTGEAWLLPRVGGSQPYPVPLIADARRFDSLLEAMRTVATESTAWPPSGGQGAAEPVRSDATPDSERLERLLRRRIGELKKRRAALQRQLEGESADHLRELGNLLLARKADVPRGAASASLKGFDGEVVEVSLDPRLDAIRNADRLYDRARRRERAARAIPDRVKRTDDRIARLETGLETLHSGGETDEVWELVGGRREEAGSSRRTGGPVADETLPYRRYRSSGGLEIRVGRSSRTNDALTFRHSAPDDIWLHASQAAGAHVILRWQRRDQNPPLADLTEAAVLAALHSEARHSGMVAVDWTRRKYVRKPRKAAAGAVVPERVSTLFVEPDAEAAARLSMDD
jgi:hypothetical protein